MATIEETPGKISKEAKSIASDLLSIGSVKFNVAEPFTWVSGIKSPIYCDNRLINSHVAIRDRMVGHFVDLIKDQYPDVEVISGVATGGIPLGVLVADRLKLPFIYARQAAKEHGLKKQVEGSYNEGDKVVLIEDHISTGGSSMIAVNALRNEKLNLLGLISIMTYSFNSAFEKFAENKVDFYSLCNLETVLEVAVSENVLTTPEKDSILLFKQSPKDWKN